MGNSRSHSDLETFVGIDLGGSRGKTTAVSLLRRHAESPGRASVELVSTRSRGKEVWTDEVILGFVESLGPTVCVAVNAPLTVPACQRCQVVRCPGVAACSDLGVVWLREQGEHLVAGAEASDLVATSRASYVSARAAPTGPPPQLVPYVHRAADVDLHYRRRLSPRRTFGQNLGPIAARGDHLRRRFAALGLAFNRQVLEVSVPATVAALFDDRTARGYKRDADPWETRASIVEHLTAMRFAPTSRMSREEVLGNDHCFDALLAGYTAFLYASQKWQLEVDAELADADGYVWAPPPR